MKFLITDTTRKYNELIAVGRGGGAFVLLRSTLISK